MHDNVTAMHSVTNFTGEESERRKGGPEEEEGRE